MVNKVRIGKCWLYLADNLQLMPKFRKDLKIDLIVTDPPYGKNYRSNRQGIDRKTSNTVRLDVVVREDYFDEIDNDSSLPIAWLSHAKNLLADGSALYVFVHWETWDELKQEVLAQEFKIKNMIVLNKSNHGMGDLKGSYAPKHELLMFAAKGRHILRFPNGRGKDIWDVPVKFTGSHRYHPNEKPLSWIEPAIINSSSEGNIILDPFMGSGTTGIACVRHNRKFIGIEINPKYFEIACERIEKEYQSLGKLSVSEVADVSRLAL